MNSGYRSPAIPDLPHYLPENTGDNGTPADPYGLLFIGDPKQAIYAFRGADIFTYIKARQDVSAHYTLGTNFRSAKTMVDSVNKLFYRQMSLSALNRSRFSRSVPHRIMMMPLLLSAENTTGGAVLVAGRRRGQQW